MNPAFAEMHGYTVEELTGKPVKNLFPPDVRHQLPEIISAIHKNGCHTFESSHIAKNGTIFPVMVKAKAVYDGNGKSAQLIIKVWKTAGRKRMKEALKKSRQEKALLENKEKYRKLFNNANDAISLHRLVSNDKPGRLAEAGKKAELAERMVSLGTMAAGIAHEIKHPLNSLKMLIDGILYWNEKDQSIDTNQIIRELKKASAQVDKISLIVKQMGALSRKQISQKPQPCDLNEAVKGALAVVGGQLRAHGIEIKNTLQIPCPGFRAKLQA
jgi:PAS domain S-box